MSHSRNQQRRHFRSSHQSVRSQSFSELGKNVYRHYFKDKDITILKNEKQEENDMDAFILQVEKFVQEKGEGLSNTQLRNIYDKVINTQDIVSLKMIRPQLAYLAGRATGRDANKIKEFLSFIDLLIKETTTESMESFKQFMQMVVAYHKFYGKTK